tara:strand:+ start:1323 stop:2816 length:1494 start_codon:yes stop_codon:yes gene_type:complete
VKKIFIFQQREWYFRIGKYLSKNFLKDGFDLGCLTFKKTTHQDVVLNSTDYKLMISHDDIVENSVKYIPKDKKTLNEICDDLGIKSIWEIVQSARNHVKNYNKKTSYDFKQNISDEKIIEYFMGLYFTAKKVKEDFEPDIILLPAFVSLPHIIFNLYFKKFNTPTIGLIDSKIDKNFIFVSDYLARDGKFFHFYNQTDISKISKEEKKEIDDYHDVFKSRISRKEIYSYALDDVGIKKEIKILLKTIVRSIKSLYQKDINKITSIGNTPDNNNFFIILRDYFFYLNNSLNSKFFEFDNLDNIKNYVFFPLQTQPEDNIDILGAKYNNQIETIRQIAMRLPGNLTLVVKDHPASLDLRQTKYLNKIKNIPNVKLIKSDTNMDKILNNTKFVIIISGTISFECAMKGISCIQLGEHGLTKILPNVIFCENYNDLNEIIDKILKRKNFDPSYKAKLDKYIYCAQTLGFDLNYLPIWEKNEKGDMEKIYNKFKSEIEYYNK